MMKRSDSSTQSWERIADQWVAHADNNDYRNDLLLPLTLLMLGDVSGRNILDLGCGEGRDSVFFAGRGAVVFGVDLSNAGLDKARRLARRRGVRVRWVHGPVTGLLPTGPFDLVFSCGSLHYLPRAQRAALFARLRAMTRPGGHHAHLVFTDRLVHEEQGEIVEYYNAGELREAFVDWQVLKRADHVISCAQDGSVHGHAVEEIVAARPVGPAPWPSET